MKEKTDKEEDAALNTQTPIPQQVLDLVNDLLHMYEVVLERDRMLTLEEWAFRAGYNRNLPKRIRDILKSIAAGNPEPLPSKATIMSLALATVPDDSDLYQTHMEWLIDLRNRYDEALRVYPRTYKEITEKRQAVKKQQQDPDTGPYHIPPGTLLARSRRSALEDVYGD